MSIYRGTGGSGTASDSAAVDTVTEQAADAAASASAAASSATAAANSASDASGFADDASGYAAGASTAAANSASFASDASDDADEARDAKLDCQRIALTPEDTQYTLSNGTTTGYSAFHHAAKAAASATAAATSETNAGTSETNASASETAAASSATSAASSATTATTKASEASTSATNAATSETNAATSATNAATSESNAASSASSASTSASTATTQASNASTSATNAATSETNAATSATAAASSATSASTSATNAATSETNASTSASAASTSATNAASSATSASTSATNAATSESNAASSESAAASSATAAGAAKDAALAALDSFDDRYLGVKTSDPTLDNDGDALVTGALYYNSTDDVMKVYDGSSWLAAYADLSGALLATNNLSDLNNASSARTNLGVAIGTDVQAYSAVLANTTASYTTAEETKLAGIESGATADQTAAEIKTAYESNADTNAYTDAEKTKLSGIEASATADQTAQEIATAIDADATAEATLKSALGLGTAAYTASTAYATAAQGTLADSAVQPADNVSDLTNDAGYITGNQTITLSGDVSGSGTTSITCTVADDSHTHDGRYYTETESDSRFGRLASANTWSSTNTFQNPVMIGSAFTPNTSTDNNIVNFICGTNSVGTTNGISFFENDSGYAMHLGYDGTGSGSTNLMGIYDTSGTRMFTFYAGGNFNLTGTGTVGGDLTVSGGDLVLGGTGRIQGIDTVSASTDAASKGYVDTAVAGVGGGGATFEATADGAITAGDPCVLNSDGTVSSVSGTYNDNVASLEDAIGAYTLDLGYSGFNCFAIDQANDKALLVYPTTGNYTGMVARVVTLNSDNTMTFGASEYSLGSGADNFFYSDLISLGSNRYLYFGTVSGNFYAYCMTVSGTTVTIGTRKTIDTSSGYFASAQYNATKDRAYLMHYDGSPYTTIYYNVLSFSGTTITSTSNATVTTGATAFYGFSVHDEVNDRILFCYQKSGNEQCTYGTLGTSSITLGSEQDLNVFRGDGYANEPRRNTHGWSTDNSKWVLNISGANNLCYLVTADYDGSNGEAKLLSQGDSVGWWDNSTNSYTVMYDGATTMELQKFTLESDDSWTPTVVYKAEEINTAITPVQENGTGYSNRSFLEYWETNSVAIWHNATYSPNAVYLSIGNLGTSNLTATNYIGVAESTVADTATATIQLGGVVDTNQSGLTVGTAYYCDPDGTISSYTDKASILAAKMGIATATTDLLLKDPLA